MSIILPPDYKKIASQVRRLPVEVTEQELQDALKWILKSRAKFSQILRACQKGDFVEIEFSNNIDNQTHKDAFILGEGGFIPGFEDKICGMVSGEEKQFSLIFPSDFSKKELAGREVSFKVKINSVQKMDIPELTDEFAKSIGRFNGEAELRRSLREGLLKEKEVAESQRLRRKILDLILQESRCEIPETLVADEQCRLLEDLKQEIKGKSNMDFREYMSKSRQTEEDIKASFRADAQKRVEDYLVLLEIAKVENIEISEEEFSDWTDKFLRRYATAGDAKKDIDPPKLKGYIRNVILAEKALSKLEEYAK